MNKKVGTRRKTYIDLSVLSKVIQKKKKNKRQGERENEHKKNKKKKKTLKVIRILL